MSPTEKHHSCSRYSWFQCGVYTLIFRHDSTVMIRPSWFDREVTKQYSILPWVSYRNQSIQSESYFDDSLNISLVIQIKRTVIHNLFSFSGITASHTVTQSNVSVKSKLQHAPPGNPPGIWLFWKLLFKFPPTRAKMPFKCPTLGSIQVIKCPHPGDISQAQKWQKDGGNAFSCRTKSL